MAYVQLITKSLDYLGSVGCMKRRFASAGYCLKLDRFPPFCRQNIFSLSRKLQIPDLAQLLWFLFL